MVQRIGCVLTLGLMGAAHAEAPLMAAIFGDHAVLQRDRPIAVWGVATPGDEVVVRLGVVSARQRANAVGRWEVTLPALPAGGPLKLEARTAKRVQVVDDVLIGDVWLCSGQSNMEWTVRNALNADWEAEHSFNPRIRSVTIARDAPVLARVDLPAAPVWKVAGPDTTRDFSAVCYYFVRELQKTVDAPQGMVLASWGGTRIEAWMSPSTLRSLGRSDELLDLAGTHAADPFAGAQLWGEKIQAWWEGDARTRGTRPWASGAQSGTWQRVPSITQRWEEWGVPALAAYDGVLWYRAQFTLTAAQARQFANVSLGVIDDVDLVWINGMPIASGDGEQARVYPVRQDLGLLREGVNSIVVNVFDMWGSGGIHGPDAGRKIDLADGTSAPFVEWEYQLPPAEMAKTIPRAPWEPYAGINILKNGMIAPLGPFGFRGVAWYQGEANAALEDAVHYEQQLGALFADWRKQFRAPLPFFVVQLANNGALVQQPVDSGWARLRDAQRRAVTADGNAALAVTIDIGNRDDIHPTNKQDVGKRLARAARRVAYGGTESASGAQPKSAKRGRAGIEVRLGDFDGRLLVIGARDPSGFELCAGSQGTCRFVGAKLGDNGVVTLQDSPATPAPTRVRFCWADSPLCNLYDTTGLPVGPFEIPIE